MIKVYQITKLNQEFSNGSIAKLGDYVFQWKGHVVRCRKNPSAIINDLNKECDILHELRQSLSLKGPNNGHEIGTNSRLNSYGEIKEIREVNPSKKCLAMILSLSLLILTSCVSITSPDTTSFNNIDVMQGDADDSAWWNFNCSSGEVIGAIERGKLDTTTEIRSIYFYEYYHGTLVCRGDTLDILMKEVHYRPDVWQGDLENYYSFGVTNLLKFHIDYWNGDSLFLRDVEYFRNDFEGVKSSYVSISDTSHKAYHWLDSLKEMY